MHVRSRVLLSSLVPLLYALPLHAQTTSGPLILTPDPALGGDPPATRDAFGTSIDVQGDLAVVGAIEDDGTINAYGDTGAAYVFRRSGGVWTLEDELRPADGALGDWFGFDVALDGNRVLIAAPQTGPPADGVGAAYVFRNNGGDWVQEAKLEAGNGASQDSFGAAVDLDGDRAVVGSGGPGKVYVFERSGFAWTEVAELTGPPGFDFASGLGSTLVLDGDRLFAGAPGYDGSGYCSGGILLFERSGASWLLMQTILPSNGGTGTDFGQALDFDGELLLVGGRGTFDASWGGQAYVLEQVGSDWVETAIIDPPVAGQFGVSVALARGRVVVGDASQHTVYVFGRDAGNWILESTQNAPAGTATFGRSLAADQFSLFVGAPGGGTTFAPPGDVLPFTLDDAFATYCVGMHNSTGFAAGIAATGTTSLTANELVLSAGPVPDGLGIFYLGTTQIAAPFGDGVRCVGGMTLRLPILMPSAGALTHAVDFDQPPISGSLVAGERRHFQAWFRDSASAAAGFNLSNGLTVTFAP